MFKRIYTGRYFLFQNTTQSASLSVSSFNDSPLPGAKFRHLGMTHRHWIICFYFCMLFSHHFPSCTVPSNYPPIFTCWSHTSMLCTFTSSHLDTSSFSTVQSLLMSHNPTLVSNCPRSTEENHDK